MQDRSKFIKFPTMSPEACQAIDRIGVQGRPLHPDSLIGEELLPAGDLKSAQVLQDGLAVETVYGWHYVPLDIDEYSVFMNSNCTSFVSWYTVYLLDELYPNTH
ncbi:hypothetical protein HOR75_gp47 [Shewanella phage SppYZU05]|uniref:Uncharacterized protein n=1 Tax=Shewanella phage SppYZU05 TaxID=1970795 RepID=A0A1W6JTI1_9CAUD|nr:hypothetical protein HOR75_gp47 [Shewanella phage SppYZU05]ARM70573.1 hypothetical protein SppYZU05_47 [Shewanella phage SppYZU05]